MKLVLSLVILSAEALNPRIHGYRKSLKASFALQPSDIVNFYPNLNTMKFFKFCLQISDEDESREVTNIDQVFISSLRGVGF